MMASRTYGSLYGSLIEGLIDNGLDPLAPEHLNATVSVLLGVAKRSHVQMLLR
jgi:hypothetical protein